MSAKLPSTMTYGELWDEIDALRISLVALLKASKEFLEVLPGDLAVSFDDAEKYLALRNAIEAAEIQEKL